MDSNLYRPRAFSSCSSTCGLILALLIGANSLSPESGVIIATALQSNKTVCSAAIVLAFVIHCFYRWLWQPRFQWFFVAHFDTTCLFLATCPKLDVDSEKTSQRIVDCEHRILLYANASARIRTHTWGLCAGQFGRTVASTHFCFSSSLSNTVWTQWHTREESNGNKK